MRRRERRREIETQRKKVEERRREKPTRETLRVLPLLSSSIRRLLSFQSPLLNPNNVLLFSSPTPYTSFFPFTSICSLTPNPLCFLLFFPFSLLPILSYPILYYPDEEEFKVFGPRRCGRLCQRTSGKKNIPNSNSHNLPLSYSKIHIASLSISIPSALYIHIASPSHTP